MKALTIITLALSFAANAVFATDEQYQSLIFESGRDAHVSANQSEAGQPAVHVAPRFPHKLSLGPGAIYDLSEAARQSGVQFEPGEVVLYSPESRLVFARGRADTGELLETLFAACSHSPTPYLFDLSEVGSDGTRRSLFSGSSLCGSDFKIAMGDTAFALTFLVGPDGRADIELKGRIQSSAGPIDISSKVIANVGEEALVFEKKAAEKTALKISVRLAMNDKREDAEWLRATADRVTDELAKLNAPPSRQDLPR